MYLDTTLLTPGARGCNSLQKARHELHQLMQPGAARLTAGQCCPAAASTVVAAVAGFGSQWSQAGCDGAQQPEQLPEAVKCRLVGTIQAADAGAHREEAAATRKLPLQPGSMGKRKAADEQQRQPSTSSKQSLVRGRPARGSGVLQAGAKRCKMPAAAQPAHGTAAPTEDDLTFFLRAHSKAPAPAKQAPAGGQDSRSLQAAGAFAAVQATQAALAATAARQAEPASPGQLQGGSPVGAQQQGVPISPVVAVELSDSEASSQGMERGGLLELAVQTVCCDLPEQHVRLLQLLRLDHDCALQHVKGVAAKVGCRYLPLSAWSLTRVICVVRALGHCPRHCSASLYSIILVKVSQLDLLLSEV